MKIRANAWSKLGQNATFGGIGMMEVVQENPNVKFITADVSTLLGLKRFKTMYPDNYIDVGIAEQNMVTVAAGLALEGNQVFVSTYASFVAMRGLEQIRHNLGYLKCDVKIVGMSAGACTGKSGISHWATEDIACMRAIPNMIVMSPADCGEVVKMTVAAAKVNQPVYIRLCGNLNVPIVYSEDYDFQIGKGIWMKKGRDVAILATGLMVKEALEAAEILEQKGISCAVINLHTIKPLDEQLLDEVYANYQLIVTIEEHSTIGGLGSAVAEHKARKKNTPRQVFLGITDRYMETGARDFIMKQYGLTGAQIAVSIEKEILQS
ncbi:transketolase family protein [Hominifimenecus sp. rT4P-3]|uniref:transketolase family protein n=1 Tax=Hominifimenecus sp. rT4P-3 TaxID=3242979 RepID=UPI003DA41C87